MDTVHVYRGGKKYLSKNFGKISPTTDNFCKKIIHAYCMFVLRKITKYY